MLTIGAHLSASKGYTAMLKQAVEIGANTFQFFTRNPRGGSAKAIDENDVNEFLKLMRLIRLIFARLSLKQGSLQEIHF